MKKKSIMSLLVAMLLLASCNKEDFHHSVAVTYPSTSQMAFVYADQLEDSIEFQTTDQFTLSSNESWIIIPAESQTKEINYADRNVWILSLPIQFQANTTGKPRTGSVSLHTYGGNDWDQTVSAYYYQVPWPNITCPAPAYSYQERIAVSAVFEATEPDVLQEPDTLMFTAYGDWTLTDGTFVHPAVNMGTKGEQKVVLNIDPNMGTEERTDVIKLTSNGVTTEITYKQEIKKEEEEE